MFEDFKSGNIRKQLNQIASYIREFECKKYKDKTIEDFIPCIDKNKDYKHNVTYTITIDNIRYKYYQPNERYDSPLLSSISIQVEDITIYYEEYLDSMGIWEHKTPKAMLNKIKEHSRILRQYNKQLKNYFKYNNDHVIEQRNLNNIFNK